MSGISGREASSDAGGEDNMGKEVLEVERSQATLQ